MGLLIRKEKTTQNFSQSLTSSKSLRDRTGENDKAEFELSPPSETQSLLPVCAHMCVCVSKREGEIMAKHFLPKTSATQKRSKLTSFNNRKEAGPVL